MDPLSDNVVSQNETELSSEAVAIKRNSDAVLLNNDWDVVIKTEIKSEIPFTKHLAEQIETETVICSNDWGIVREAEIEQETPVSHLSSKKREFHQQDPVMKYNSDHKIEIKDESWWPETEMSSVCDDNKEPVSEVNEADEAPSSDSPRLSSEGVFQDGNGTRTSLTHSESGHCLNASGFKTGSEFTGTRPYKCDRCEKSFKFKSILEKHIQLHSDIRPYKCDICEKTFKWSNNLEQHIESHSGKRPYKCDQCQKCFKRKNNLVQHIMFHSDTRPYKCSSCEKTFKWKTHLEQHTLLHSDIKPYKCDRCDKSFKRKFSLVRHVVLHSDTDKHH